MDHKHVKCTVSLDVLYLVILFIAYYVWQHPNRLLTPSQPTVEIASTIGWDDRIRRGIGYITLDRDKG